MYTSIPIPRTNHTSENKTYSMKSENGPDSSTEDSGNAGLIAGTVVPILLIVGLIILALVIKIIISTKR